ncbi:MAG: vitamin K epoxide reductase family protein [Chloroflexi bacterium]|nr:vitamin K epoxide reductase family protein [Chloroflexota bacterium]
MAGLSRPRQAAVILLGLAGLVISSYLTYVYYTDAKPVCIVGSGCDIVQNSRYATIFGSPLALIGMVGYAGIIGTAYGFIAPKHGGLLLYLLALAAFTLSSYLTYLETVVLAAACSYCLVSYGLITGILVVLLAPTPILTGVPWKRYRLLSLAVVAGVLTLALASHGWAS